jgi:putative methylase
MITSQKELAVRLSKLAVFQAPKRHLEQYSTDSNIAASMLWDAYMHNDIAQKIIADLGSGTGILGIGALLLGARHVHFIERDADAIAILRENLSGFSDDYSIFHGDATTFAMRVDVVIQNPPFGAQIRHADTAFLEKAIEIAPVIYTVHNHVTVPYLRTWIDHHGLHITHERTHTFPLRRSMQHHQKKLQEIRVVTLRISA